jgi:pimeloyl-ACP methyl ester carboxylesterase
MRWKRLVRNSGLLMGIVWGFVGQMAVGQSTRPIPYGDNPAAGKFYDLHGFRMYVEVYGSGEPVLMIHGNGGSISAFSQNIPELAKNFEVIVADSRSQGKSVDPDHSLSFEMMADDFSDLLEAMHIDSANVIGWSDGGINALLLAIRHPGKVKKLVATGANLWPDADAFRKGLWDGDKAYYEANVHKERASEKEKNGWKLFMLDWEQPHISLAALGAVRCPALIVCGDHDVIAISHTVLIFQNIRHANLWVVPNSGHATLIEHAAEFNRKCEEFFTSRFVDHE